MNYRTTHQNLQFAVQILGDDSAHVDLESDTAETKGYRAARRGPQPQLVAAESIAQEYDGAADSIQQWLTEVDSAETIGILVHAKGVAETVQRAMTERGIDAKFVGSDADVSPGKVVVMTMHRSKGMEFTHVLLFGIGACSGLFASHLREQPEQDRADALLQDRSLLYVAATRARDKLAVMWRGERSELLPAERT